MKDPEEIFEKLLEEAKGDPNVIGLFLGGSRGKGLVTEHSDYDVYIVVKDGLVKSCMKSFREEFPAHDFYIWVEGRAEKLEVRDFGSVMIFSFSGFAEHATVGSPFEWNRYNFAHLKALVDKNGEIQKLINEKGRIPKERIRIYVSSKLNAYINSVYRSLKCLRDNNTIGARLDAADSVRFFLNVIFGLEGRITPYYKYLEWELQEYPLKKFGTSPKELVSLLLRILEDADVKMQNRLFELTEIACRRETYGRVFNDWGADLDWIKAYAQAHHM